VAHADGDASRSDALVAELVRENADVIVVATSQGVRAALRTTKTVPIVMAYNTDPVGNGFVASLARPGGNVTGIASQSDETLPKLVQILHEATPEARRFAILLNRTNPNYAAFLAMARRACAALDLVAVPVGASAPDQLQSAVEEIVRQRSQAVVVPADGLFTSERVRLQALLQSTGLPGAFGLKEHALVGGLLSYGPDLAANFRRAAQYVDRILKGANPADLPVEQPTKFELVINVKTAKSIALRIPRSLLLRADELIE
jgi:putative ABC transport system substrate-binding protein